MPQGRQPSQLDRLVAEESDRILDEEADRQQVPRQFVRKIKKIESGGAPDVITGQRRSSAGAIGAMQLMPGTARDLKVDPYDIEQNLEGGVRYAKQQLNTFGDERLAASAYNAGPGAVKRARGIPRIAETQKYAAQFPSGQQQESDLDKLVKEFGGTEEQAVPLQRITKPQPRTRPSRPLIPTRGPVVSAEPSPFTTKAPTGFQAAQQEVARRTAQISPDVAAEAERRGRELARFEGRSRLGQAAEIATTGALRGVEQLLNVPRIVGGYLAGGQPSAPVFTAEGQQQIQRQEAAQDLAYPNAAPITRGVSSAAVQAPAFALAGAGGVAPAMLAGAGLQAANEDWSDPKRAALRTGLSAVGGVGGALGAQALLRPATIAGRLATGAAGGVVGAGAPAAAEQLLYEGRINPQQLAQQAAIGGITGAALPPPAVRRVGRGSSPEAAAPPFRFRYDENGNPIPEPVPVPLALDERGQPIPQPDIAFPPLTRDVVGRPSRLGSGRPEEITDAPERMRAQAYFGPGRARAIQERLAATEPRRITRELEPERQTLPIERTEPLRNLRSITSEQLRTQPLPPQPDAPPTQAIEQPAPPPSRIEQRRIERGQQVLGARDDAANARTQAGELEQAGDFEGARRARIAEIDALRAMRTKIKPDNRGGRIRRNEIGIQIEEAQANITKLKGQAREAATGRRTAESAPTAEISQAKPQGRIVRVGDEDIELTPEQADRWAKEVDEPLGQAEERYRRNLDIASKTDDRAYAVRLTEQANKNRKAVGMQVAAVKRQIAGRLTPKEQAAKTQYEASNFGGKAVSVDGVNGKVIGSPFGKVRVQLEDGRTVLVEREQVSAPVEKTAPNTQQRLAEIEGQTPSERLREYPGGELPRAVVRPVEGQPIEQVTRETGRIPLARSTVPSEMPAPATQPQGPKKVLTEEAIPQPPGTRPKTVGDYAESLRGEIPTEDLQAYQRLLSRYEAEQPRAAGIKTRPGQPFGKLGQFNDIVTNHKAEINRLDEMNLDSAEAQPLIQKMRDYAEKNRFDADHVDNILDDIRNFQTQRAEGEDIARTEPNAPTGSLRPEDPRLNPSASLNPRWPEGWTKTPLPTEPGQQSKYDRFTEPVLHQKIDANNAVITRLQRRPNNPKAQARIEEIQRSNAEIQGVIEGKQPSASVRTKGSAPLDLPGETGPTIQEIRAQERERIEKLSPQELEKSLTDVEAKRNAAVRDPDSTDAQRQNLADQVRLYRGRRAELVKAKQLPPLNAKLPPRGERPQAKEATVRSPLDQDVTQIPDERLPKLIQDAERILNNPELTPERKTKVEDFLRRAREQQKGNRMPDTPEADAVKTASWERDKQGNSRLVIGGYDGLIFPYGKGQYEAYVNEDKLGVFVTEDAAKQAVEQKIKPENRVTSEADRARQEKELDRAWRQLQQQIGDLAEKYNGREFSPEDRESQERIFDQQDRIMERLDSLKNTKSAKVTNTDRPSGKLPKPEAALKTPSQVAAMKQENQPTFTKERTLPNGAKEFSAKMRDRELTIRQLSKGGSWDVVDQNGKVIRQRLGKEEAKRAARLELTKAGPIRRFIKEQEGSAKVSPGPGRSTPELIAEVRRQIDELPNTPEGDRQYQKLAIELDRLEQKLETQQQLSSKGGRIGGQDATPDEITVFKALSAANERFQGGGLASFSEARKGANLSKEAFDAAALSLMNKGILAGHAIDDPYSGYKDKPEELAGMVKSPYPESYPQSSRTQGMDAEYYIGAALFKPGVKLEEGTKPKFVTEAEQRLEDTASGKRAGSGIESFADQAIVTGYNIYRTGMKYGQWAREVTKQAGNAVRPHLQKAWNAIQTFYRDESGSLKLGPGSSDELSIAGGKSPTLSSSIGRRLGRQLRQDPQMLEEFETKADLRKYLLEHLDDDDTTMNQLVKYARGGLDEKAFLDQVGLDDLWKLNRRVSGILDKAERLGVKPDYEQIYSIYDEYLKNVPRSNMSPDVNLTAQLARRSQRRMKAELAVRNQGGVEGTILEEFQTKSELRDYLLDDLKGDEADQILTRWARRRIDEPSFLDAVEGEIRKGQRTGKIWEGIKGFYREEGGSFPASPGPPKRRSQTAQLRAITAKTVGKPRTGLAAITAASVRTQQPAARRPLPPPPTALGATKSRFAKGFEVLGDLYHGPKSLLSSFDLSAAGRQGFFLSAPPSQLPVAARAFGRQVKSLVSTKSYDQFVDRLRNNADYQAGKDSGLFLATDDPSASFSARDESFVSKLIGKLPHVKYSEQAYKTYLDSLRMDTFGKYKRAIERQPGTAEQKQTALEAAAEWINTSTGRGKLHGKSGEIVEAATPLLNTIFFAPRFTISRFQMLNPATYGRNLKNPQSRVVFKKQMSELFQSAGVLIATGALAKAAGADVSLDPEEADFLKLKFGNTRYDVLAGLQQMARLTARIGDWIRQEFTEEDQKKLASSRGNIAEALKRFGRTKLAPIPSFFVDWLNDWKNVIGERTTPSEFTVKNPIAQRVLPIMFSDMVEAYMRGYREGGSEQGLKTTARFAPALVGIGAADYERKPGRVDLESGSGLSRELRRLGQSFETVRAKQGEPEKLHRERSARIEDWFKQYGEKLINSNEYKSSTADQQERAIQTLRGRIGEQANLRTPRMDGFEPGRIFRSIRMGERRRERSSGRYIYQPED